MSSLYTRLFTYREREGRSPLEDFSSEALADLLGRLSHADMIAFLGEMLGAGSPAQVAWEKFVKRCTKCEWITQRPITWPAPGFIDLVVEVDGIPAIVIENKIGSGIRSHAMRDGADGSVEQNQLTTYGGWLAREANQRKWPGALIFLSHTTVPPPDFLDGAAGRYAVPYRATVTWAQVSRILKRWAEKVGLDSPVCAALAADFLDFLEENEMTTEGVRGSDLAALQSYLPSIDRIMNAFAQIWREATTVREGFLTKKLGPFYRPEGGLVWIWSSTKPPSLPTSWIGIGLRFPEASEWWKSISLPDHPHAFVSIDSRDDLPIDRLKSKPSGWVESEDGEFIAGTALHTFSADPEKFNSELATWVVDRLREARTMLEAMGRGAR